MENFIRTVRTPIIALATLCALDLISIPAAAQGTPEQRAACEGDAQRVCGHCIPDVNCITSCMIQRQRYLSPGCRATMRGGAKKKRAHR
jgi:hypothetical protein